MVSPNTIANAVSSIKGDYKENHGQAKYKGKNTVDTSIPK